MEIGRDRAWDPSFVGLAIAEVARANRVGTRSLPEPKAGLATQLLFRPFGAADTQRVPPRCVERVSERASERLKAGIRQFGAEGFRGRHGLIRQFQEILLREFARGEIGCTLFVSRVARLLLNSPFPSLRPRLRSGVFRFGALATCLATCSLWRGSRRFGALATCFATCSLWFEPRRVFCFRSLWRGSRRSGALALAGIASFWSARDSLRFRSLWRVSRRTSEFWQLLVLARMEPVIAAMSKAARRCIRQRVHRCTNASTAFGTKTSVQDRVCGSLCAPAMRATRGFLL